MTPSRTTRTPARRLVALAALLLVPGGCYDPAEMIERVRNDAIRTRLEEVDLGQFHVTLPRDTQSNEMTEVFIDLYGAAVRYRLNDIRKKIKANDHIFRQDVLIAIRDATNEELTDPGFVELRKRLLQAVNATLGDTPVEKIGLKSVRLVRH